MRRILIFLLSALLVFSMTACAHAETAKVMTSFYPMYIFALNVFGGIDAIEIDCMTAPETGCLHDYQLLVGDMMKLSDAAALIVCGAGMENYLPDVQEQFPELAVIDCSQGIDLLTEEDEDGDGELNAHTWLDARNAVKIVETIAEYGCQLFPEFADQICANALAYTERLNALDEHLREELAPVQGKAIVTFHDAFPYFANAYGLEIAAVISEEHEETLSPAQLSQVIETVRQAGNPPLFTEPQYSAVAAYAVSAETGAPIYTLDPLVSGAYEKDAYEAGMQQNAEALLEAFK